jgi:hypothetical protein
MIKSLLAGYIYSIATIYGNIAIWNFRKESEFYALEGMDMGFSGEKRETYSLYETDFLKELALADDFAAQQMLAKRLFASMETIEEARYWANIAIARGSKNAILSVVNAYQNPIKESPGSDNIKRIPDGRQTAKAYMGLYWYRSGKPNFDSTAKEDNQDDSVAQEYFTILDEVLTLRQSLGLSDFANREMSAVPQEFWDRCYELDRERIRSSKREVLYFVE